MQVLPKTTHMVEHFNRIAWDVLQTKNVSSLDGYWMTLARPDHREIVEEPERVVGNKLAHAGPEVYSVMLREIIMLLFSSVAPGYESLMEAS